MYTFSGRSIEKLDETRYRVDKAVFTTCEDDTKHPPWSFHLKKANARGRGLWQVHQLDRQDPGRPGLLSAVHGLADQEGTIPGSVDAGLRLLRPPRRLHRSAGLLSPRPKLGHDLRFRVFLRGILRHRQRTPVGAVPGRRRVARPLLHLRQGERRVAVAGQRPLRSGRCLRFSSPGAGRESLGSGFLPGLRPDLRGQHQARRLLVSLPHPELGPVLPQPQRRPPATHLPPTPRSRHHASRAASRGRVEGSLDPVVQQRHLLEPDLVGEPLRHRQGQRSGRHLLARRCFPDPQLHPAGTAVAHRDAAGRGALHLLHLALQREPRPRYLDEPIDRAFVAAGVDIGGPSISRVFNKGTVGLFQVQTPRRAADRVRLSRGHRRGQQRISPSPTRSTAPRWTTGSGCRWPTGSSVVRKRA